MTDALALDVVKGVHAGALEAIAQARRLGTNLVVWRDGRIVEITPDEADEILKKSRTPKEFE